MDTRSLVACCLLAAAGAAPAAPATPPKADELVIPGAADGKLPPVTDVLVVPGARAVYPCSSARPRRGEAVTVRLHVFLPPDWRPQDNRPAVVFFAPSRDKTGDWQGPCAYLSSRGLIAVAAEHVAPSDGKQAVRFLRANAGKLGVDPRRIATAGPGSPASHAGMDAEPPEAKISGRPNAMVLYEGAGTKEVRPHLPPHLLLVGVDIQDRPSRWASEAAQKFHRESLGVGNRCELTLFEDTSTPFYLQPPCRQQTNELLEEFLASVWDREGLFVPLGSAAAAESGFIGSLGQPPAGEDRTKPLDPAVEKAYRDFIRLAPHHRLSWTFLLRLGHNARLHGRAAAETAEFESFVRAAGDGPNSARALAHLMSLYPIAVDQAGEVRRLAAAAKISARTLGDMLTGEQLRSAPGAQMRMIRQAVRLDARAGGTPGSVVVSFLTPEGWRRHVYWSIGPLGRPVRNVLSRPDPFLRREDAGMQAAEDVALRRLGATPRGGRWATLSVPIGAAELDGQPVLGVGWTLSNGKAWWGRTSYVEDGKETVLLDGSLPEGAAFAGPGAPVWDADRSSEGKPSHMAGNDAGFAGPPPLWKYNGFIEYHLTWPRPVLDFRPGGPRPLPGDAKARDAAVDACAALPEVVDLLDQLAAGAGQDCWGPAAGEVYRAFLTRNPASPQAHRVLLRLLAAMSDGAAARQRFGVALKGAADGREVCLALDRRGRKWDTPVGAWSPPYEAGRLPAAVRDANAAPAAVPVLVQVPRIGGEKAMGVFTLRMVPSGGAVWGTYAGTFDGKPVAGRLSGTWRQSCFLDQPPAADTPLAKALADVRALMDKLSVAAEQRKCFDDALGLGGASAPAGPAAQ